MAEDNSVFMIKRGNEFLVALPYQDTLFVRWSIYKYDGAMIHRRMIAKRVADRVGGRIVKFNPVSGRLNEV